MIYPSRSRKIPRLALRLGGELIRIQIGHLEARYSVDKTDYFDTEVADALAAAAADNAAVVADVGQLERGLQ